MTGLSFTGNLIAILVLLLVIGGTWLLLRSRLGDAADTRRRHQADKGKVKCYHVDTFVGSIDEQHCKNIAGWVTPNGYFCDEHQERHNQRESSRVRWAHPLIWRRTGVEL